MQSLKTIRVRYRLDIGINLKVEKRIPLFTILQSLEIILVMIFYELLSGGGLLSGNRRGNRYIRAGIKFIPIIVQVKSSKPHSPIVTFHISGSLEKSESERKKSFDKWWKLVVRGFRRRDLGVLVDGMLGN